MSNWKDDLGHFFKDQEDEKVKHTQEKSEHNQKAKAFIAGVAGPALEQIKAELESKHGRKATVEIGADKAWILVKNGNTSELDLTIVVYGRVPNYRISAVDEQGRKYTGENMIMSGSDYPIEKITIDDVIQVVIQQYKIGASHGTHYNLRHG